MRIFISADIEGISGVVAGEHTVRDGKDYARAREWMVGEVNAAIKGAVAAGADSVLVNDSHDVMRNILVDEIDPRAVLLSGQNKLLSMVEGIESGVDGAIFVGYHARAGSPGVLSHTYSGVVYSIKVNGIEVGESGLNAGVCGSFGVPVILVSGDDVLAGEVAETLPGTNSVVVKRAHGRFAAECLPPESARQRIEDGVRSAVERLRVEGLPKPYRFDEPCRVELAFKDVHHADAARLIPVIRRVDARTVVIESDRYVDAFRTMRALIALAGVSAQG
jgi:D-amino peptidase